MSETVVEVQNVTRCYGKLCAVQDLSLTVDKGESFGFLGPNGAGKTTTIKMLTGFIKPDSGSIRIMGHDLVRDDIEAKSVDGTQYSDPASVSFSVQNSKAPAPADQPFPFIAVIVLILVAGVAVAAWRMMRYRDPPPPQ